MAMTLLAALARHQPEGRQEELETLDALAAASTPAAIWVHGIAGCGKSALLRAFATRAKALGARVVAVDGRTTEPTPPGFLAGFDYHPESIAAAREAAREAGVDDRVTFEVADAGGVIGEYDLIAFFDSLHDLGDPVAAARRARATLAPGGACMIVEPFANDRIEDNLNPVGRSYYGFSALLCTPGALSQGETALGTQAGEGRLREVLQAGGFGSVRRAAETPFNLVLEARA